MAPESSDLYKNPITTVTSSKITDDMKFLRMTGKESLGRAFVYEVELAVENGTLDVMDVLDSKMTVLCETHDKSHKRYFHGQVDSFAYLGAIDLEGGQNRHRYRATLRPKLWALNYRADCRIFQDQTTPDIIKQVLQDAGFAGDDYQLKLSATYKSRTYCVQYRESDFNFVSRLMEEEGIYYFIDHTESKHVLVLCDAPTAHKTVPDYTTIVYDAPDQQPKPDHINGWEPVGEVTSGKYTLRDYDFLNSALTLEGAHNEQTFTDLAVFDYPGLYDKTDDGLARSIVRLGELRALGARVSGRGPVLGITTGTTFTLAKHPREDQNAAYLVVSSNFELESDDYQSGSGGPLKPGFRCDFVVIKSSVQYRPPRVTRKPFVQGPQTAIVVGPQGDDDIYTDANGRVKVQFFWDRVGKKDDKSSCWVRVASIWAGNGWGAMQLPRIKQEVIVDFLEGDPDRPIITGRVYNDQNKVPYTLPDEKTKSTIKTRSTTGGNDQNFNELRFEDKKDSEEIYFHAEKDFNRVVENNDTVKVGFDKKNKGDQTIDIFNNQTVTIGNDKSDDGSQTVTVYKNRSVTIKTGDETFEVSKGKRDVTVKEGNDTHTVTKGDRTVAVNQGNDKHTVGQGNRTVEISQGNDSLTITQGNQSIKISAGKSETQAGQSITLTVGGSSIKIEPAQITIKSAQINIQADAKVSVKAPMIEVSGDAMVKLAAGIVKIN